MLECYWAFVVVRPSVLATNTPSVSWLLVAAAAMFSMYVSTCGIILEAVAVATLAGAWLMVPEVFALQKEIPCCLFALLAQFVAA